MTTEAPSLELKRELMARGEYRGDTAGRIPCMQCVRRELGTARAALVTAAGYARTAGKDDLATAIEAVKKTIEGITP